MKKYHIYFPHSSGQQSGKRWMLLLLAFFYLSQSSAFAQLQLTFNNFTVEDGLSNNYIKTVFQDSEGFIWVGTEDGLNKFDGYSFYTYHHVPNDTNSITEHPMGSLMEDKNKNLWVGTWGGGLFIYNREQDNFHQIKMQKGKSHSLSSNFIYTLFLDSRGNMWIGTNNGLNKYDSEKNHFINYLSDTNDSQGLNSNHVISITEDQKGNIWIGTLGGGISRFDPQKEVFQNFVHNENDPYSISGNEVNAVFCDSKNRIWVGTWGNGIDLFADSTEQFTHFYHHYNDPVSVANNQIWAIHESEVGNIWIGTDDGLSIFDEESKSFHNYKKDPVDAKSLVGNTIKMLYKDKQNRIWIGTYNNGLGVYDKRLNQFKYFQKKGEENSISDNNISAFLETENNQIWIGTDGGGLNLWDRNENHFSHFMADEQNNETIASNKVKALLEDQQGRIWICFWGSGLDVYNPNSEDFNHFSNKKNELNSANITTIGQDGQGYIWLGSFGGGVTRFHPDSLNFEHFKQGKGGLSDRFIWTILVDSQDNIWVGELNGSLDLFNRKTGKFEQVSYYVDEFNGHSIHMLKEDSQGRIWVGTEGGGLKMVDPKNKTVLSYSREKGLPSNSIISITEDDDSKLWLGSNNGISCLDPATGNVENYNTHDGLQGLQFNRNAAAKIHTGEMLMGGVNGFNLFHPDSLQNYELVTPIELTNFQIFNKPVPIGKEDSPLQEHINETELITLPYDKAVFSLEYVGLNYTYPQKIKYKYRLENFVDESWQEVGNERKVSYTSLDPGQYEFMVTAFYPNNPQLQNPVKKLSIVITPPWWQTWWARMFFILLVLFLIWLLEQWRLRTIRNRSKWLEKEVTERTLKLHKANKDLTEMYSLIQEQNEEIHAQAEELAESNDEIRTVNQRLEENVERRTADLRKSNEELDNFVYRVSHDIRAPLASLMGLVSLMEKDQTNIAQYLSMANKSIHKLDGFVSDILDYSRNSRMQIERKEIDFSELLQNILEELQYMKNADRVDIIRDFHIDYPHYSDISRLHIIFRNLFSNAIKYQNLYRNAFIKLRIMSDEKAVFIEMEDNGVGIDEQQLPKVFEMFYRGSDLSTGSGIGLYIVKETVDKLNGQIGIQSKLGNGTTITMRLPNVVVQNAKA